MPVNYEAQQGEMLAYNQASRWAVSYPPLKRFYRLYKLSDASELPLRFFPPKQRTWEWLLDISPKNQSINLK